MMIDVKKNVENTVVEIVGRLDTTTAPSLETNISETIGDAKNLILDLKGLEYISSAGLRVLLATQKKMKNVGTMKVINVFLKPARIDIFLGMKLQMKNIMRNCTQR